jgi:hypothetical protein
VSNKIGAAYLVHEDSRSRSYYIRVGFNNVAFKEILAYSIRNVIYERAFDRKDTIYLLSTPCTRYRYQIKKAEPNSSAFLVTRLVL